MDSKMESFKTNDGITIKYIDTACADAEAVKNDILILVRPFLIAGGLQPSGLQLLVLWMNHACLLLRILFA
jgi:hypothetical protein